MVVKWGGKEFALEADTELPVSEFKRKIKGIIPKIHMSHAISTLALHQVRTTQTAALNDTTRCNKC